MRVAVTVGLGALMMTAAPAAADWRFTKWGMSPAQVITAGAGSVVALDGDAQRAASTFRGRTCEAEMAAPQEMGGVTFSSVRFCFDNDGKLASVDLRADADDFAAVDRALASAFGQPAVSDDGAIPERIYNDEAKGNTLRLVRISDTILSYSPRATGF